MFRILALCAFLAATSAVSAQMPAVLDDARATPDAHFNHDIVLHDVFAGDLFRMNIEAFGGAAFFLRIEDDARSLGGTVNIASRLESHDVPDLIPVSEQIYGALKNHYQFEERGSEPPVRRERGAKH